MVTNGFRNGTTQIVVYKSMSAKLLRFPKEAGIKPPVLLELKYSVSRLASISIPRGITPERSFLLRSKKSNLLIDPTEEGTCPAKLFLERSRVFNEERLAIWGGRFPPSELRLRFRLTRLGNWRKGKSASVPTNFIPERCIRVIFPFESQEILFQSHSLFFGDELTSTPMNQLDTLWSLNYLSTSTGQLLDQKLPQNETAGEMKIQRPRSARQNMQV